VQIASQIRVFADLGVRSPGAAAVEVVREWLTLAISGRHELVVSYPHLQCCCIMAEQDPHSTETLHIAVGIAPDKRV
jgi:hypothetical protein